jgi:hypothetical protein
MQENQNKRARLKEKGAAKYSAQHPQPEMHQ